MFINKKTLLNWLKPRSKRSINERCLGSVSGMTKFLTAVAVLVTGFWAGVATAAVEIEGVRLWAAPDSTRVVLDLDRPVEHKLFTLKSPNRVVIDLNDSSFEAESFRFPAAQGFVANIRSGRRDNGVMRVVIDLNRNVRPKSFLLKPNEKYGHRLVIDLGTAGSALTPRTITKPPANGRDVVVAVVAGHGGEDPGAIGRNGTREKDVVFSIAKKLTARINAQPGMSAVMIRNGDYYVPLVQRMELARRHRADLFVAIHADSFTNRRAQGASVYVLSERGASDEASRRLAERENASDLIGGVSLADKDDVLASVLLDLSQSYSISASMNAADKVLGELEGIGRVHKSKVQQAQFVVLKSPDIPSILVETAFISNLEEEKKLKSGAYQDRMATAILRGIAGFFEAYPPPGTLIAQGKVPAPKIATEHVIRRGETLSGIANRYRVTINNLRNHNSLRSDRIRVGQVLRIPASY